VIARAVLAITFVVIVGIVQGRTTGKYPSLTQWVAALRRLQPFRRARGEDTSEARSARRRNGAAGRPRSHAEQPTGSNVRPHRDRNG
jgi:hypothetical protein